jgi:hypothetical protein
MPAERLPMRQVREVLRLKHVCGRSGHQIAATVGVSRHTVAEYLRRAGVVGITWPVPSGDCQLGGLEVVFDHAAARRCSSCCHLDARLLPPDPKGLGASAAVLSGGHEVPPRTEVAIDHGVHREEALRLLG